jgi:hypothetical protein
MTKSEVVMVYHRKPETKSSYLKESGPNIFPDRIGFLPDGFTPIKRAGAALLYSKMGQVKADFKKTDISPYKPLKAPKPYIHFTLFWVDGKKDFGFANVGFQDESGRVLPTNDLVIARFLDPERSTLEIRLFGGLINHRDEIIRGLRQNAKGPEIGPFGG